MKEKFYLLKFLIIILIIFSFILLPSNLKFKSPINSSMEEKKCYGCIENDYDLPIMHHTKEDLDNLAREHENADIVIDKAKIDKIIPSYFSLLNNLPWDGYYSERNQGYAGNCWVWAGTGIVEAELYRVSGIKTR